LAGCRWRKLLPSPGERTPLVGGRPASDEK
jgi:hypothetical protein